MAEMTLEGMMKASFSLAGSIEKIRQTPRGREAAMYGPIRDIFIHAFGYPASDVEIDTAGESGRPDVSVRADSGLRNSSGSPLMRSWIVVEAKCQKGVFSDPDSREAVFSEKSKYIESSTAWFVMIDPSCLVARRVDDPDIADIILDLDAGPSEKEVIQTLSPFHRDKSGSSRQLRDFRAGEQRMIASVKLQDPALCEGERERSRARLDRRRFFNNLREATLALQSACRRSLAGLAPGIREAVSTYDSFSEKYGNGKPVTFDPARLLLEGRPQGPTQSREHDTEAKRIRKVFAREPHVARLALHSLPEFRSRTGVEAKHEEELFAIETANLILARILLLRFFEDHGFFGEKRYICNGGVEAFQKMREYFGSSYTHLLGFAYRQADRLYSAAFGETELDWVFGLTGNRGELSDAIEWVLFLFARYDFRTVKGDILSGIYDRFMNRSQRKKMGEFFTPPSLARWMIRRVGLKTGDRVLDPACGSGTFLIEAFRETVGIDAERGLADYGEVVAALDLMNGNDINTFSSVLTQIQLLWQILHFKSDIETRGFPDLRVASRSSSILLRDGFTLLDEFGEMDKPVYDVVLGNPPFIRPERIERALDERSRIWFEATCEGHPGISPGLNSYALFTYKALSAWCREAEDSRKPGRLAFVTQLSLFDSNKTADLRRLFCIGGRWTILEILDLEIIYRSVFDADVIPAVIICERRPATAEDRVSISVANSGCVKHQDSDSVPEFDFDGLPVETIAYGDIFTPSGLIMTHVTEKRLLILKKLWALDTLDSVSEQITGGVAFRNKRKEYSTESSQDVYKGENIIACELYGDPVEEGLVVSKAHDPSIWRSADLPETAFAFAQVAHVPNAARFEPATTAFTNTATLLVPKKEYSQVPFDIIMLSSIYRFFYALSARMGVLRTCRSHIYPTNLRMLPFSPGLSRGSERIEGLRERIIETCTSVSDSEGTLSRALDALGMPSLKQVLKADRSAVLRFSEALDEPKHLAELSNPRLAGIDGRFRVLLDEAGQDWFEFDRKDIAAGFLRAAAVLGAQELTKSELLALLIPMTDDQTASWDSTCLHHSTSEQIKRRDEVLSELDAVVGEALGLSPEDVEFIGSDMRTDPFLSRMLPRFPGSKTRIQGFRKDLDSSDRYRK